MYSKFQLTRLMRGVTSAVIGLRLEMFSFQLTRLMRGVTLLLVLQTLCLIFQLTRLMRGVTQDVMFGSDFTIHFNSHASCEA